MKSKTINFKIFYRILLGFSFFFIGCSTIDLPLCPVLMNSRPSEIEHISTTLKRICEKKNIEIIVLSSTAAEFKGSKRNIDWLIENYSYIICDFDSKEIPENRRVYTICHMNTQKWIDSFMKKKPEYLGSTISNFSICVEEYNSLIKKR
jgi:hypothetical protein